MVVFAAGGSGRLGALEGDSGRGVGVFVEVAAGGVGVAHGAGLVAAAAHDGFGALEEAAFGGLVGFLGGRWGRKLLVCVGGGAGGGLVFVAAKDGFEALVLEETADDLVDVEGEGLILVFQTSDFVLQLADDFSSLGFGAFQVAELVCEAVHRTVAGRSALRVRRRGTQEVTAAQCSIQRLLSEKQLEAVVVFDEPGVGHPQVDHLLLQLAHAAPTRIVHLHHLDLQLSQLEAQVFDDLIFLVDELGVVA